MDLKTFSNEAAQAIVASGRLTEMLKDLGCRVWTVDGKLRGVCPVCCGRLAVYVNTDGPLPIGWACSQQCHKDWHPSLLGLVRAALSHRPGGKWVKTSEAATYLRTFLA